MVGTGVHGRPFDRLMAAARLHHPQQQPLAPLHHLVDELHGVRIVDGEGEDHVRVDHQLPERQDGMALHVR